MQAVNHSRKIRELHLSLEARLAIPIPAHMWIFCVFDRGRELKATNIWSTLDYEHIGMALHSFGKGLVVSDGYHSKAPVLQLGAKSRIFVLSFRDIVMRSVHEYANSWEVLSFVVEVWLDMHFPRRTILREVGQAYPGFVQEPEELPFQ